VGIVFACVSYTVSTLLSGPIRGFYDSPFHGATLSDDNEVERSELVLEIEEMTHLKRSIRRKITETRRSGGDATDN
jgi:hypothetical protein